MKKSFLLSALFTLLIFTAAVQAQDIVLIKDTALIPQGWSVSRGELKFKKNSTVSLNDTNQVITGVLDKSTYLRPTGWHYLINDHYFAATANLFGPPFLRPVPYRSSILLPTYRHIEYKGNTSVTFDAYGCILSGTLNEAATFQLQPDSYGFVTFKEDTVLTFYPEGRVRSGTLKNDYLLRPASWQQNNNGFAAGFIPFKAGTAISFDAEGFVSQGVLKEPAFWTQPDDSTLQLPKNTVIQFSNGTATIMAADK